MKAKETGYNVSFFSFPMGKSAKQSVADCCGLERFDAKVLSLRKILKCAVDTFNLCLELQLVTQAPLTIFQQSTWGMKNSVAREEQRQVRKPDT